MRPPRLSLYQGLAAAAALAVIGAVIILISRAAGPQVTPGAFRVEPATLEALGFEWDVTGDANRNAAVDVQYRLKGATTWLAAQPLLRSNGEKVGSTGKDAFLAPNRFAGSVLNLQPGKTYEVKLTMTDPDRPGWIQVQSPTLATRAVPEVFTGGTKREVHTVDEFKAAYAAAKPGDIINVHAGTYKGGNFVLNKKGTLARPIVIQGAGDGVTVFDGDNFNKLFVLNQANYTYFQNLTMKGSDFLISAGEGSAGTIGLVVRNSKLSDTGFGIFCISRVCRNSYIAGNTITGRVKDWNNRKDSAEGTHAIWLAGQGHVVTGNIINKFWDGPDLYGGKPTGNPATENVANDFYGNTISEMIDDGSELDYGLHNIRFYNNFIYNVFDAISTQPIFAGPAYIYRNRVYNDNRQGLKLDQNPTGLLIFNNTFIGKRGFLASKGWSNAQIKNNLFLGVDGNNDGYIWAGTETPATTQLDYNGYRADVTPNPARQILWQYPSDHPKPAEVTFKTLADFTKKIGYETHGLNLDYNVFVKAGPPSTINTPLPVGLDLHLRSTAQAIDKGVVLANITDGYKGAAPDLGAIESPYTAPPPPPPPPVDTIPPTVAFTAPAANATLTGAVKLQITAADNVGVTRVDLGLDGNPLATLTTAPYEFNLDTATITNGAHSFKATAFDAAGNHTDAALAVIIQNTTPPPAVVKPGDINGDGRVNIFDLSALLKKWGTNDKAADLNHDGQVDIFDLSILLSKWEG